MSARDVARRVAVFNGLARASERSRDSAKRVSGQRSRDSAKRVSGFEEEVGQNIPDMNPYNYLFAAAQGAIENTVPLMTGDLKKTTDAAASQVQNLQAQLDKQKKQNLMLANAARLKASRKFTPKIIAPPAAPTPGQVAKEVLPYAGVGLAALALGKLLFF